MNVTLTENRIDIEGALIVPRKWFVAAQRYGTVVRIAIARPGSDREFTWLDVECNTEDEGRKVMTELSKVVT